MTTLVYPSRGDFTTPTSSGDFLYGVDKDPSAFVDLQIYRYHAGSSTLFAPDTACHVMPAYDGQFAVYTITHCGLNQTDPKALVLNENGVETVLVPPAVQSFYYYVRNGWLVYYQTDPTNNGGTVWARTPSGATLQVTSAPTSLFPESLGPAGQYVYTMNRRRYVAVPSGSSYTTTDIRNSSLGFPYWIDGQLFIAIGGTLLQVSY